MLEISGTVAEIGLVSLEIGLDWVGLGKIRLELALACRVFAALTHVF